MPTRPLRRLKQDAFDDDVFGGAPPEEAAGAKHMPEQGPAEPGSFDELVVRLRALNVHVQSLWERLACVRSGAAALAGSAALLAGTVAEIAPLVATLDASSLAFPRHADSLIRVANAWDAVAASPLLKDGAAETLDTQQQLTAIDLLEKECRTIVYWTTYVTAARRLSEWMGTLRPGYAILFHDVFKDEIPFIEERQQLLTVLASSPKLLAEAGGWVDGEAGVVYRYETNEARRWRSVGWVASVLAMATAIVVAVGLVMSLPAAGFVLIQGWAAALVGAVVHIGVTTAKRVRAGGASGVALPVDRFSIEVNAKLGLILLRIGMLLLAYLGLLAGGLISIDPASPANFLFSAFLTGYSLDSVIDLLSARLDQQAAAQVSGFKSQLAP